MRKHALKRTRLRKRSVGGASTTRKKNSKNKPPRIVILDNDETTGSYWALFSLIHIFRDNNVEDMYLQDIIPIIAEFAIKTNIFRPGLIKLIKTLYKLRARGLLDAVVMYTYQNKMLGRKDDFGEYFNSHGQQVHMPRIIDYCFGYIATGSPQPFCNTVLTREDHREGMGLKETDNLGSKSVELVMQKLQMRPTTDLRGLIFIDDCYLNQPVAAKYTTGPLTAMYIKDYRTIMSEVQPILDEFVNIYHKILHKYISKSQFDEFMDRMRKHRLDDKSYYSECAPKGVSHTYDMTDLTKLASYIEKYYTAGKF